MEPNETQKRHCLNCQTPLLGDFCHQCGQKSSVGRVTFSETFSHFLNSAFSYDGLFFKTTRLLFTRPGLLFREYVAGKRKSYYTPVAYFILLTAIYLIIRSIIQFDPLEGEHWQETNDKLPELARKSRDAARFMVKHINHIMFVLVLAIGLSLKLFFRKRYNLAEYTSYGFYITGVYILTGVLFMLITKLTDFYFRQYQLMFMFGLIVYYTIALFPKRNVWLVLKSMLVSSLSIFLYMVFGYGISLLMVW